MAAQQSPAPVALTPAQALADELALDCALVAFFTGRARDAHGNGRAFAPAWDLLDRLVARQLVETESRGNVASPLVWLTEGGHEVIEDIREDGEFGQHIATIAAAA